ncbi:MAG: PHP domain-containing protein [Treponema sp.]|jgi:predicted metal-dependent phosphoesterase TrpH|nr:PHP domain-containing protein [Treponema sp.]
MVDLHTHSNASDGDLSPGALIREAVKRGLSAIALTDHDTINGLESARNEAQKLGIRFIPGIEIEIKWRAPPAGSGEANSSVSGTGPGGEFHLLGLGISRPSPAFLAAIAELSRLREARNREILEKMRELSIEADYEDIKALSGGHSVGRPHFASLLVNRKIVKTREQAFARYLGAGKPLYVPKEGLEFEKAAAIITESGGIPVLAHPMSLYVAWGRLPGLIQELQTRGLMGIEAWHPTAKVRSCKRLEEIGKSLGLFITAGSDFHGSVRPDRRLGLTTGGREIEDSVLEKLPLL